MTTAEARLLETRVIAEIGELMAPLIDRLSSRDQKRLTTLLSKALEQ